MRIKVLGCSGGVGPGLRTTSLLVDDEILIDAGTGIGELSLAQMRRIGNVFITHSHLDHVCGLAFMADNLFDLIDRPMQIYATAETLAAIREHVFNWKIWPDFSALPSEEHPLIKFQEIKVGKALERNGTRFTAFTVLHTVPAVGYAVEKEGKIFVFSGDTYAYEPLWEFLNKLPRLDKFMVEIAFPDEQEELGRTSKHFTPSLLGRELKKLKHHPQLFLTHHKPGLEQIIEKQCRKALAGWEYQHLRRGDVILP
jgi:ribonuclease BN (tRNA processing enzyme)